MNVFKRGSGLLLLVVLAAGSTGLGGCCSLGIKSCPATDHLTFRSDAGLNSCSGDQFSYPVAVRLYYLGQAADFETAEFRDLWEDADDVLGDNLLDKIDLTITPGSETPAVATRPAGAAYLGIVANFCRLDGGSWREIIPLEKGLRATVRLKDVHLSVD